MSRLEQMRELFVQRIQREQQQQQEMMRMKENKPPMGKTRLAASKSIQNIAVATSMLSPVKHPRIGERKSLGSCSMGANRVSRVNSNCATTRAQHGHEVVAKPSLARMHSLGNLSSRAEKSKSNTLVPLDTRDKQTHLLVNTNNNIVTRQRCPPAEAPSFECHVCKRKFAATERLDKHVQICAKTFDKRRTIFNSAKQRRDAVEVAEAVETVQTPIVDKNNTNHDWKQSRQRFLEALREARRKKHQQGVAGLNVEQQQDSPEQIATTTCSYCKRSFSGSVIVKHETICGRLYRKNNFSAFS